MHNANRLDEVGEIAVVENDLSVFCDKCEWCLLKSNNAGLRIVISVRVAILLRWQRLIRDDETITAIP